jgi:hypothetical protein
MHHSRGTAAGRCYLAPRRLRLRLYSMFPHLPALPDTDTRVKDSGGTGRTVHGSSMDNLQTWTEVDVHHYPDKTTQYARLLIHISLLIGLRYRTPLLVLTQ